MEPGAETSRRALVDAVRALLPTRAWHRVSVQMICSTANVSRSTFYAHFDDKQNLLDLVFADLKSGLGVAVPGRGLDHFGKFCCLPWLVSHLQSHLPLLELNRPYPSGQVLFEQFRNVIDEAMREEITESRFADGYSIRRHDFLVGGVFGTLEAWCAEGCLEPDNAVLEELDESVGTLLGNAAMVTDTRGRSQR